MFWNHEIKPKIFIENQMEIMFFFLLDFPKICKFVRNTQKKSKSHNRESGKKCACSDDNDKQYFNDVFVHWISVSMC